MNKLFIILLIIYSVNAQNILDINNSKSIFKSVKNTNYSVPLNLHGFSFYGEKIITHDTNFIYLFDKIGNQILKFGKTDDDPFRSCQNLNVLKNEKILFSDYNIGIEYLCIYDPLGKKVKIKKHHPLLNKVVTDQNNYVFVGGAHLNRYSEVIEDFDENSITPSRKPITGIREYYKNAQGYWIIKYDTNLNPVDSLILIPKGEGEQYENASSLNMFSFDIDKDNTVWLFGFPDKKVIQYSDQGELMYEFDLLPEDAKIPGKGFTNKQWKNLRKNAYGFHRNLNLIVIDEKIIISHTNHFKNIKDREIIMSVYNKNGQFIKRGSIPNSLHKYNNKLYYFESSEEKQWLMEVTL